MHSVYAVSFFILGSIFGSFSNLIIYRLPRSLSIVKPRSHCVDCNKTLPFYHNIPLVSCLILKAKCFSCGKSFGWQHFFVELLMAVGFMYCYLSFGLSLWTFEAIVFVFGLITISFIDLEFRIIPDSFSLGGIVFGLGLAFINPNREFSDALLGVIVGGGFFWLVAYLYYVIRKEYGLGGGDIKLLGWIGAVLGWKAIPFVIVFSSILGSLVGLGIMISKRSGLKTSIPYGPFLALAAILYLFWYQTFIFDLFQFFFPWLDSGSKFDIQ